MNRITPQEAWAEIRTMLARLRDPATRDAYLAFHDKHRELALAMPASVKAHHHFPSGYVIHIREVMANLRELVSNPAITMRLDMGFGADDAITAAYVHDLDKLLYRYELDPEKPSEAQIKFARTLGLSVSQNETKSTISAKLDAKLNGTPIEEDRLPRHRYRADALSFEDGAIVTKLCWDHGLPLSMIALHAVCVHHGGWSPMARTSNRLSIEPLGCLLHVADLMSSTVQRGEGHWASTTSAPVATSSVTPAPDDAPPPPPDE